ncbi:MAG TPA: nuclease-related domain-containing protein, partial [Microbacterium sp.]|nr:nuclease-related domain-containing protein [Microbacterium sp.]
MLARAKEHERAAAADRAAAGKFEVAAVTENRVARKLSQLAAFGYTLLNDRAWPGSRRAQVDLVVVGPSGVFIVDTKAWADLRLENGRVYQGDDDVT